MNNKPEIQLSETVALIDAAFLNFVVTDVEAHFKKVLKRDLQEIDVAQLTTYLALDAGIADERGDVQFLFVYDEESAHLHHCRPRSLEKELNGVAFQSDYGEFSFAAVTSEGMVTREHLFMDLLSIIANSADVKKMLVISFDSEYGDKVTEALNEVKDKSVVQFRMDHPSVELNYRSEILAYPLMQALGIKASDL